MKPMVLDIHTHTIASGHAYGTIREMTAAAAEAGLSGIGFTEHSPGIPGTCHPIYFKNLTIIPRNIYGVNIYHGCEVNVLNDGTFDLGQTYVDRLDYLIAGVHVLCYEDEGREKNTDHLIECMKHPKVHFVSHPDDDRTPLDYERLAQAAKEYGVALEINNSSFVKDTRLNYKENYAMMIEACKKYGTCIYLGTDAHDPSAVGNFDLSMSFLAPFDFDEDLIINNEEEKFRRFIGFEQ